MPVRSVKTINNATIFLRILLSPKTSSIHIRASLLTFAQL
jgi:hypothetical protein